MTTEAVWRSLATEVHAWFARRAPRDAVDDLVQETFLRIHRGLPTLRDSDRIAPWVFRIARSVLVDHLRRQRPTEALDTEPIDESAEIEIDVTPIVAGWLPGFVDALPEAYRDAIRLSELEGVPQSEVAKQLGLSKSGARTRVQRGRQKLKEDLLACCAVQLEAGKVVDVSPQPDCC